MFSRAVTLLMYCWSLVLGAGSMHRMLILVPYAPPQASAAATAAADPEVAELKAALLDSFWGTERGLAASSDARAEINELITQVGASG